LNYSWLWIFLPYFPYFENDHHAVCVSLYPSTSLLGKAATNTHPTKAEFLGTPFFMLCRIKEKDGY
jgi:hypothetical protein